MTARNHPGPTARRGARRTAALAMAAIAAAVTLGWLAVGTTASAAPVQTDPADTPPTTVGPTTSMDPVGGGDIGRIIPAPNSGQEPQSPGDRGGWQQITLFFLICGVIVGMGVFVWWRSRVARRREVAAGTDPVTVAKAHGADVRRPRVG